MWYHLDAYEFLALQGVPEKNFRLYKEVIQHINEHFPWTPGVCES